MKVLVRVLQLVLFTTALFFLFVRTSVWLVKMDVAGPWMSVVGGAVVTSLLLAVLITVIYRWLAGNAGSLRAVGMRLRVSALLVLTFALYSSVYLPRPNAKVADVATEFHSLHPVLRIGVKTVLLGDRQLLVTDAARVRADYEQMGLNPLNRSSHYVQADGYVHAVDIRTNDRSEMRNRLLNLTFRLMGYRTLRHTGTADHLHVAL